MKNIYFIILVIFIIANLSCEENNALTDEDNDEIENLLDCIPMNIQNSVIGYYPFSNGLIDDFSGNDQHLTNTTTASSTSDRNGNVNCAFEFDFLSGTNEFLTTSNTSALDLLVDFSISLWYQPLLDRDPGSFELLIGRGLDFQQWELGLFDCRKAVFGWTSQVWDNDPNFDCGVSDFNNDWHHLIATFDNDTSTMRLYRNGVLQETSNTIYNPNVGHIEDLFIGSRFTGKIDDIIIFDISLNQSDVNAIYNMDTCCN